MAITLNEVKNLLKKVTPDSIERGLSRVVNKPLKEYFLPTSTAFKKTVPELLVAADRGVGRFNDFTGIARANKYLGLDRPVIKNQSLPAQLIDMPLRNLRAGVELLNAPSYALGGILKASNEARQGNYQGNKYIHPALTGAYRGITQKQGLFEEAPRTLGINPESGLGLAVGLGAEIATPDPLDALRLTNKADDVLKVARKQGYKRGMIEGLQKQIDDLMGGFGRGLSGNYKQDYAFRMNLLRDSNLENMGAPPKVVNELKKLRDGIEELQEIRKTGKNIGREKAERVFKESVQGKDRLKGLMGESLAQTRFRRNLGLKTEDVYQTAEDIEQQFKALKGVKASNVISEIEKLKDISPTEKGFKDVFRISEKVFGDQYPKIKKAILDPFDTGKKFYTDMIKTYSDELEKNVISKGIKKGSKESEALQLFGEGKLTPMELTEKFGKFKAQRIIDADKWFRKTYDELLDTVNATRRQLYPNNPEMIIPKRKDYYRHFQELSGLGGLKNIFENPAGIDPNLVGISDFTQPKSRWLAFAQKRTGDSTDYDAVAGFLDYLPKAAYASQIDPHTLMFRKLTKEIVEKTGQTGSDEYAIMNNFIEFLQDYANDLAGKTNPLDRPFQKYLGRKTFKLIDWANKRVKANTILGNLSSSIAQIFNAPQGIASAGERNFIAGLFDTVVSPVKSNKVIDESGFIAERYMDTMRFDTGLLNNTKKFAVWMTGALDEFGTKSIWNAHYKKAIREGIENPIKYADDITRKMVAGRGIGEVPLIQKSKVFQVAAPFQLEVANLWHVMGDNVSKKEFDKLAKLLLYNYAFNSAVEPLVGRRVTFDPIDVLINSFGDEEVQQNPMLGITRMGGEVLSNLPLGQTAAAMYPEFGGKIGDTQLPTRKRLFGDSDPTRYGGGLMVAKGIQDPLFKLAPPFGGNQLKKTLGALQAYRQGGSFDKAGRRQFDVNQTPGTLLHTAAMGKYVTPEAQRYFDIKEKGKGRVLYNDLKKLSPEEAAARAAQLKQTDPQAFNSLIEYKRDQDLKVTSHEKNIRNLGVRDGSRARAIVKKLNKAKTPEEKAELYRRYKQLGIITENIEKQLIAAKQAGVLE